MKFKIIFPSVIMVYEVNPQGVKLRINCMMCHAIINEEISYLLTLNATTSRFTGCNAKHNREHDRRCNANTKRYSQL